MAVQKILNIGILAHVDAGKTSITENILYHCGEIKQIGSVDSGTTHTDTMPVERARGISVRSAYVSFKYKNIQINLIDTPGHIDFSTEVERSLQVLDFAIIVISAVEGIQAHTENLWLAVQKMKIPVLLLINKIDRLGADIIQVLEDISKTFTSSILPYQRVQNDGFENIKILAKDFENQDIELLANFNENILEKYLEEEEIEKIELIRQFSASFNRAEIFPILFSSAKMGKGIKELLDFIVDYFHAVEYNVEDDFSARVFAVRYDEMLGKMVQIKILSGSIAVRNMVYNQRLGVNEKVSRIRKQYAQKQEDINKAVAGEIVSLAGLSDVRAGDILGRKKIADNNTKKLNMPLLNVQVKAVEEKDYSALARALQILNDEDPDLDFKWLKDENELNIKVMGEVQTEILMQMLENRFGIKARFENPTVIYKEAPTKSGEGYIRYTMPKPCWAVLKFKIEPLPSGSGVVYSSEVGVNNIKQKYQNEVEQTISLALEQGIKGWEVTDIKITLIEGEDHEMHSRPGDFRVATPMGIMNGLQNVGTTLLEPVLAFKIKAEEQYLGSIAGDIHHMRGTFESPVFDGNTFVINGLLPLSTSINYAVTLASRTGGKAMYSTSFHSYQPCSDEQGVVREFRGISPLDTAKYILKARKALQ